MAKRSTPAGAETYGQYVRAASTALCHSLRNSPARFWSTNVDNAGNGLALVMTRADPQTS
jgi:hypothetical protein